MVDMIKDLQGKKVYVELFSNRKYSGNLDQVTDLQCKIIRNNNGKQVIFPKEQIKFIQEEE